MKRFTPDHSPKASGPAISADPERLAKEFLRGETMVFWKHQGADFLHPASGTERGLHTDWSR